MKRKSILAFLWIGIFTINGVFAQHPSDTLNVLSDQFAITEMYILDNYDSSSSVRIDDDIIKGLYMDRLEFLKSASFIHAINVIGKIKFVAIAHGKQIKCVGLTADDYVLEQQCFDGKMISSFIDDTTSLVFVFERLLMPDSNIKDREYVSFTYYFDSTALQVYGYKVASNYDPKYMIVKQEKTAAQLKEEADYEVEIKNYTQAVKLYSQAIELDSTSAELYFNRGNAFLNLKELDAALNDFKKCIELAPHIPNAYISAGLIEHEKEQYEFAVQYYNKAIEIEPNSGWPYLLLSSSKSQMLDFNGAIEDINKAIELEPSNWISYFSKGVTLSLFFENDNQALDAFSMAISLNPNAGEAYYYRGNVKLVLKDTIGACSDWRKALDLGITEATVFIDENCN